jgi:hypothetical protein
MPFKKVFGKIRTEFPIAITNRQKTANQQKRAAKIDG